MPRRARTKQSSAPAANAGRLQNCEVVRPRIWPRISSPAEKFEDEAVGGIAHQKHARRARHGALFAQIEEQRRAEDEVAGGLDQLHRQKPRPALDIRREGKAEGQVAGHAVAAAGKEAAHAPEGVAERQRRGAEVERRQKAQADGAAAEPRAQYAAEQAAIKDDAAMGEHIQQPTLPRRLDDGGQADGKEQVKGIAAQKRQAKRAAEHHQRAFPTDPAAAEEAHEEEKGGEKAHEHPQPVGAHAQAKDRDIRIHIKGQRQPPGRPRNRWRRSR